MVARGLLGDVAGEPVVISPLYKQRFRLRDGVSLEDSQLRLEVWPVRVEQDRVWVYGKPGPLQPQAQEMAGVAL
ncbi:Nitrite reductase [NAD(P)H] small subunit [Serratia rubidaea]|uniref:Nitrite reductase [NAD(P)H] small subunit n=1 Tax=Serratia rubidaea TaxID=61652 RepID=A0A447QCQ9_SERRU|nr:Nitrite reductase [NAD(P)H] small subunit [Serratia rubidaea]